MISCNSICSNWEPPPVSRVGWALSSAWPCGASCGAGTVLARCPPSAYGPLPRCPGFLCNEEKAMLRTIEKRRLPRLKKLKRSNKKNPGLSTVRVEARSTSAPASLRLVLGRRFPRSSQRSWTPCSRPASWRDVSAVRPRSERKEAGKGSAVQNLRGCVHIINSERAVKNRPLADPRKGRRM